jgi:hypothetical protein
VLGRRAREEGCVRVCRARVAVRREVRAVAGKRGMPRGRATGFMCFGLRTFSGTRSKCHMCSLLLVLLLKPRLNISLLLLKFLMF